MSSIVSRRTMLRFGAASAGAAGAALAGAGAVFADPRWPGDTGAGILSVNIAGAYPMGLSRRRWANMQRRVLRNHGYRGPIDGLAGPATWSAMQRYLTGRKWGYHGFWYTGAIDGVPGRDTILGVQLMLGEVTSGGARYPGPFDGIMGPRTLAAFSHYGDRPIDACHSTRRSARRR